MGKFVNKADISEHQTVAPDDDGGRPRYDDMLPEYHFDYRQRRTSRARPNRFATDIVEGSLIVVLEPDIAQVFKTPESIQAVLRPIAGVLSQQSPETVSG